MDSKNNEIAQRRLKGLGAVLVDVNVNELLTESYDVIISDYQAISKQSLKLSLRDIKVREANVVYKEQLWVNFGIKACVPRMSKD